LCIVLCAIKKIIFGFVVGIGIVVMMIGIVVIWIVVVIAMMINEPTYHQPTSLKYFCCLSEEIIFFL
jgi:hypothetical protein